MSNKTLYEFYNDEDITEYACIRILSGQFEGLAFHFGTVQLPSPEQLEEDGTPLPIKFSYELIDGAIDESETDDFKKAITEIFADIVESGEALKILRK